MRRESLAVIVCLGVAGSAGAESTDKRRYTLFNPTPPELMREMSTDRPDTTESAHTVDAGHLQIELSFIDYAYDGGGGASLSALSVLPSNLKLGLLNDVDLQLVFTPYVRERVEEGGVEETAEGFGDDTEIRVKINLWGNDGPQPGFGDTAFAVMPFIKLPTGTGGLSNDRVEGGVIAPLSWELPADFGLGLMAEVDALYDDVSREYGVFFLHTAEIGRDIPGLANLAAYIEYIGILPNDGGDYQPLGSGGLTYALSDNWMLDCGTTFGLSAAANDVTAFIGSSFRH